MKTRFPTRPWRPALDILACYIPIAFAIFLSSRISFWFYPLSALIIANRLLALSLLCHEGLHGNLFRNRVWNDRIGRYLCAFPTTISFSKYRKMHTMHHLAVGKSKWDPDRHLYDFFPEPGSHYILRQLLELIQLKTALQFILYYTEFPELLRRRRDMRGKLLIFGKESDFLGFFGFIAGVMVLVSISGIWREYLLFYLIPLIVITQPYVLLMGGLQHGPMRETGEPQWVSRSIRGPKWLMEILLPCDINFHAEHHRNPGIPHYWLRTFARELDQQPIPVWRESYLEALGSLIVTSKQRRDKRSGLRVPHSEHQGIQVVMSHSDR